MPRGSVSTRSLVTMAAAVLLVAGLASNAQATNQGRKPAWGARYNGPLGPNAIDEPNGVAVSPDGAVVFVTGRSDGVSGSYNDYATIAYDAATGAQRWVARYNGPGSFTDIANALAVSPDGSTVFVTGFSGGSDGSEDFATIAYDTATGTQQWLSRYNGPAAGDDVAYALRVSPDGSVVFVAGASDSANNADDYTTIAYDSHTGGQRWFARYKGSGHSYDAVNAMGISPDGATVFVTGNSIGASTSNDVATIAYDAATGSQRWVVRYDGPSSGADSATALGVDPDGAAVYVTGKSVGVGSAEDYATIAYDATTGNQLWVARYNGPGNAYDSAEALGVSPDGSLVFVTGQSSDTFLDFATLAYDTATGTQQWLDRFDYANGLDRAWDLAVSPDGSSVFVTGEGAGSNLATVAYRSTTGGRRWVSSSGGAQSDGAKAVAVSPDGATVFVAGDVEVHGQDTLDYFTVAIPA